MPDMDRRERTNNDQIIARYALAVLVSPLRLEARPRISLGERAALTCSQACSTWTDGFRRKGLTGAAVRADSSGHGAGWTFGGGRRGDEGSGAARPCRVKGPSEHMDTLGVAFNETARWSPDLDRWRACLRLRTRPTRRRPHVRTGNHGSRTARVC